MSGVWYGRVVKKGKFTAADQSKLVSYNDSIDQELVTGYFTSFLLKFSIT